MGLKTFIERRSRKDQKKKTYFPPFYGRVVGDHPDQNADRIWGWITVRMTALKQNGSHTRIARWRIKKRATKEKSYYVVLTPRALELHKNERMHKYKRNKSRLIDLATVFNVTKDYEEKRLGRCICLMMPEDTYLIRAKTDEDTERWYDAILSEAITARALKLGRPVFALEFFEFAWDVNVVREPKLKHGQPPPSEAPSILDRLPQLNGQHRLCLYPHTVIITKIQIEPAKYGTPESGIPPFRVDDFLELPRKFISTYGQAERYFYIHMGHGSPTGICDVWMQCPNDEQAKAAHDKLEMIIHRETEKKRALDRRGFLPHERVISEIRDAEEKKSEKRPSDADEQKPSTSHNQPQKEEGGAISVAHALAKARRQQLRELKALLDSFDNEGPRLPIFDNHSRTASIASIANSTSLALDVFRGTPGGSRKGSCGTPVVNMSNVFNPSSKRSSIILGNFNMPSMDGPQRDDQNYAALDFLQVSSTLLECDENSGGSYVTPQPSSSMRANVDVHRASPERKVEREEKKEELEYMEPMGTQCQYVTMCPSTSTASSAESNLGQTLKEEEAILSALLRQHHPRAYSFGARTPQGTPKQARRVGTSPLAVEPKPKKCEDEKLNKRDSKSETTIYVPSRRDDEIEVLPLPTPEPRRRAISLGSSIISTVRNFFYSLRRATNPSSTSSVEASNATPSSARFRFGFLPQRSPLATKG